MRGDRQSICKFINRGIILIASVIRVIYILLTTVGDRQHDLGYATLLSDGIVNPGHLGYVEYIAKFHHIPDFDPFSIFSYYHPPMHHIIAAFFVSIAKALGVNEPLCYEAIQIPTLIYSIITIIVAYYILKLLCDREDKIIAPLALIALHPGLIYMTGSVNNDMLATMMSVLCMYTLLLWVKKGFNNKHLYVLALLTGLAMISKMNTVVFAAPIGMAMLLHLIAESEAGRFINTVKTYIVFAVIAMPIGLSWSVRNLIRFHVKPGISSATPDSNQYLGSFPLMERIGFPVSSSLGFPFHSENASFSHNAWQILFKTSIFTEIWPDDISAPLLMFCQIAYVLAVILGIICAITSIVMPIIRIRKGEVLIGTILLTGYVTLILTYILFVIKYPYTCSCDFRYVAVALLYAGISLLPLSSDKSN